MSELNPINKAGKALSFVGEHTEQVTRFAEYLATIDRLPGGDTYGNRLVGIKNAAEVTVDFSRKGTWGKAINAWIPIGIRRFRVSTKWCALSLTSRALREKRKF